LAASSAPASSAVQPRNNQSRNSGSAAKAPYTIVYEGICATYRPTPRRSNSNSSEASKAPAKASRQRTCVAGTSR